MAWQLHVVYATGEKYRYQHIMASPVSSIPSASTEDNCSLPSDLQNFERSNNLQLYPEGLVAQDDEVHTSEGPDEESSLIDFLISDDSSDIAQVRTLIEELNSLPTDIFSDPGQVAANMESLVSADTYNSSMLPCTLNSESSADLKEVAQSNIVQHILPQDYTSNFVLDCQNNLDGLGSHVVGSSEVINGVDVTSMAVPNTTVLEASSVESLLEKFEATQTNISKQKMKPYASRKIRKNTPYQRSSILISPPPASKKKYHNSRCQRLQSETKRISAKSSRNDSIIVESQENTDILELHSSSNVSSQPESTTDKPKCLPCISRDPQNKSLFNEKMEDSLKGNMKDVPCEAKPKLLNKRKADRQRIIYIGRIPKSLNKYELGSLFSKYGDICEVVTFVRKFGDNYGFVTFSHSKDAETALLASKSDPNLKSFQLCYGARREFCDQLYSDLDSESVVDNEHHEENLDFDKLLQNAKAEVAKKKSSVFVQ